MAVVEGADIGAIFSLYVAAFVLYSEWIQGGSPARRMGFGVGRLAVVTLFAGFLATQTIIVLVSTQIKGVAGTGQDTQTKQERWDFATQWSLPKREVLGLVIPGLFGYRMDTPDGGVYWGAVGRDPNWYHWAENGKQGPEPSSRGFSGGGIYAGVLVVMVALWAALQSFRKKDSVYTLQERRMIWFWVGVVVISLPLAFGRFAPFYQLLYALPYFSTIRNPGKFLHPMSWAMVVLFAYGVHGLWRRYMEAAPGSAPYGGLIATWKAWWQRVRGFDRRWTVWSCAVLGACALGWLIYASSRQGLEAYLQEMKHDPGLATAIASFSFGQVGRFVLTLALAIGLMSLVLAGVFRGPRAKWGALLLGLFVVADLARANQPWIIVWNYKHKYASNPVIEMLRQKPYEHRVAVLPRWFGQVFNLPQQAASRDQLFSQLYGIEWSQHLFLYYNIQSLDVIQMPRMPQDLMAFDMALTPRSGADLPLLGRKWQLTDTRYLLGIVEFLDVLNQGVDPAQHRFRIAARFQIEPKSDVPRAVELQDLTAAADTNGPFAVFEFTGALPRAKLYSNWQLETSPAAAASQVATNALAPGDLELIKHAGTNGLVNLRRLTSQSFDPERTVMVGAGTQETQLPESLRASASTNQSAGKVEFTSYAPKDIVLKAEAPEASILLLNDRYDPNWKVLVDGKTEPLLRCNFLMRGVLLQPGTHTVQFKFEPPMGSFYVSLAAVGLGILLVGFLAVQSLTKRSESPSSPATAEPVAHKLS
jgi:hypothetical protein